MGQAEVVGAVVEGGFAVIDKYFWHILWALVAALVLNIFVFVRFVLPKVTKPFLNPHEFQPLTLIEKERLTHNTSWLRFALPHNTTILGLPTGAHIIFKLQGKDGKDVFRPYTPVSDDRQLGFVDFVIKVYPTGKMTPLLEELKVGDTVPMKGPRGQFRYQANKWRAIGESTSSHKPCKARRSSASVIRSGAVRLMSVFISSCVHFCSWLTIAHTASLLYCTTMQARLMWMEKFTCPFLLR